ncbi:MAG: glycosyltransferase family 2 protein [Anaerolineae bacterium]|nr:glycosyltransferase family 2 protein [Anaerolineae bacterium]
MLDLSIIIVSWNVRDFLAACLTSIQANSAALDCEVIVVDSASSDDSVEMLRSQFSWVKLLPQAENVGFTKGNNIGLKAAQGRYVLLLNPDTEMIEDALVQMVRYLDAHPDVGIIGPRTQNTDGSPQSTRRRFPTLITAMFDSTWLAPYAPRRVLDDYYARDVEEMATADVDWVQGSALMTRRVIYEQIGGLDERYVMFSEELDWCKRIRSAGWRTVYLGGARIVHHGGKSTEQVHALKHIYFQQSKIRYFGKFHGALAALWVRLFLIGNYVEQLGVEGIKGLLGSKRDLRHERVQMYWQVIRALVHP